MSCGSMSVHFECSCYRSFQEEFVQKNRLPRALSPDLILYVANAEIEFCLRAAKPFTVTVNADNK